MKTLIQKLNSKRGVSIVMALLLALICLLAGAAALTAASANVGRYTYLREDQQEYLSISSAARLLKTQFEQGTGKISAQCNGGTAIVTLDSTIQSGSVYSLLNSSFMQPLLWCCYNKAPGVEPGASASLPSATEFTVKADGIDDKYNVKVKVTAKPPEVSGSNISEDLEVELKTGQDDKRILKFTVSMKLSVDAASKKISVTDASVERITLPGGLEGTP